MGADLYIRRITEKARETAEPLFNRAVAARDLYYKTHPEEVLLHNTMHNTWAGQELDPAHCKCCALQDEVETHYDAMLPPTGYFRDSYNASGFLNRFGLSWWTDVIPMLNNKRELTPRKAALLRTRLSEAQFTPMTEEELIEAHAKVDDENTVELWNSHYILQRDRFLKFLNGAIEAGDKIDCSL